MRYEARLVVFDDEEDSGWLWRWSAALYLIVGDGGDSLFERVKVAGGLCMLFLLGCVIVTRREGVFLIGYGPFAKRVVYEIKKEAVLDAL